MKNKNPCTVPPVQSFDAIRMAQAFTVGLISLFAERRVAPTLAMTG